MQIELSIEEGHVLREALRRHLHELDEKIARAGAPGSRQDLESAHEQLAEVAARLEHAMRDALPAAERAA